MLGIVCAKCGVTFSPTPCAAEGVARAMVAAAIAALAMDRIFMMAFSFAP
jgi:hypothetical protein